MIPHLPRPARAQIVATARASRRQKSEKEEQDRIKMVKRSKAPSRAFDALYSLTPPFVSAIAAPDSD